MDDAGKASQVIEATIRRTRFSDVCGTIDELKRVLHEEPEAVVADPEPLIASVDDALFMLSRMRLRLQEYEQFREAILAVAADLGATESPPQQDAASEAAALNNVLRCRRPLTDDERATAVALAEAIRQVAQNLENTLYRYKRLALAVGRAYRTVQGNRPWVLDEAEAQEVAALPGEPGWVKWLPPSPHRERIIRYLQAGRAHLLRPDDPGESGSESAPLIQFEDGGVMPLPLVRWSEEVRNFYPADQSPHPHGLRYREA